MSQSPNPPPSAWTLRLVPFSVATAFFLLMAGLYLGGERPLYYGIIRLWGVDPWPFPFLDTDTVMSALRCLRMGVDVFLANPCDSLARVYDYSPLWLVLARLPVTQAWLTPAGLAVDVTFLLSLLLLPAGRSRSAAAWIAIGVVSSPVLFAVERGNNDLVLFVLAVLAATLACRSPALRLVGYGAALLAGLLKYYPITLLLLATRERPGRFFAVAMGAIVFAAIFVATMGYDLYRALHLIPSGAWFGSMFGSRVLPGGFSSALKLPAVVQTALQLILVAGALAGGIRLSTRPWFTRDLSRLTAQEEATLLVGLLLILSCFFTAQNISYRAIHLLLVLPALTALRHSGEGRRFHGAALLGVIILLWSDAWRVGPDIAGGHSTHPVLKPLGWTIRELTWWWVVTVLIGCAIVILRRSTVAQDLLQRVPSYRKTS